MLRAWLLVACALALVACDDDGESAVAAAATVGSGGSAGAPAEGGWGPTFVCQPGERDVGGVCEPAGIAPADCGPYHMADGDRSCVPVLPVAACAPGTMALPGETQCRAIAPCDPGTWGSIPVDGNTEHVDTTYAGGNNDGSALMPWTTIGEAVAAAAPGAIVAVAAGTYSESVVIDKPIVLWGKCPTDVVITGSGGAAIDIAASAGSTEIRDLAVSGAPRGVRIVDADLVLLDRLWIHDTVLEGIDMLASQATSVVVSGSLIERAGDHGIDALGVALEMKDSVVQDMSAGPGLGVAVRITNIIAAASALPVSVRHSLIASSRIHGFTLDGVDAVVEDVVVLDTIADDSALSSAALAVSSAPLLQATLEGRRLVLERNGNAGVFLTDAEATLEAVAIRDNDASPSALYGDGIFIITVGFQAPGQVVPIPLIVRNATIDRVHNTGVTSFAADVTLEGLRVRDVEPYHLDGSLGRGIDLEPMEGDLVSHGTLNGVVVEGVREAGIANIGGDAMIDGALVRDIAPTTGGGFGRGISFDTDETENRHPTGQVRGSLVENVYELGVGVIGGDITVENTAVKGVQHSLADGYGACFAALIDTSSFHGSTGTFRDIRAEDCEGFGLAAVGSEVTLENGLIRGVYAQTETGLFGDGVTVSLAIAGMPIATRLDVVDTSIEASARCGVTLFGAPASLSDVRVECNAIDLDGESLGGYDFSFEDLGANRCGCMGQERACKVVSSGLQPPPPLR